MSSLGDVDLVAKEVRDVYFLWLISKSTVPGPR